MTLYEFVGDSSFLTWCALWLGWGVVVLAITLFEMPMRLVKAATIMLRGWPPTHVDANGNFRSERKQEKQIDKRT